MDGTLPRFNLQPESETPEDSPLLQVKPLSGVSRRRAFQSVISLAELMRASRLITDKSFPQADFALPIPQQGVQKRRRLP
jgi:hypothetical protein